MGSAETEVASAEQNGHAPSLLDDLRARRREIGEHAASTKRLLIPGYSGDLAATYSRVAWEDAGNKILAMFDGGTLDLDDSIDVIVTACKQVEIRVGEDYLPLHEYADQFDNDEPVRWDARLASVVDVDPNGPDGQPRARSIVRRVIGNDYAVVTHGSELAAWLVTAADEVDQDF